MPKQSRPHSDDDAQHGAGSETDAPSGVNVAVAIGSEGGSSSVKTTQRIVQRDGRTVVSERRMATSSSSDEREREESPGER